jgi:hypothetical protein
MNFRQVISNIKEGQEFKCGTAKIKCVDGGSIAIIDMTTSEGIAFTKDDEFIKIERQVNFMDAIKANKEGKTIKVIVKDKTYTYYPKDNEFMELSAKETHAGLSTSEILEGKWYIEEDEKEKELYPFQLCTDKWITKDGIHIEIKDMSTRHLRNAYRMIEKICKTEKWNPKDYEIYNLLKEECSHRLFE